MRYCPSCGKQMSSYIPSHLIKCAKDLSIEDYKIYFYEFNFPNLKNIEELKKIYETEKKGLPFLCEYVGGIDLKAMCYVLNYYNIKIRSNKENWKLTEYVDRIKNTNLIKFGNTNPLGKNTTCYIKRNNTVKEKYGVDNVWQCLELFIPKYKSKKCKISKLNLRVAKILTDNNIVFKSEFTIKYINNENKIKCKFYDFKIGNYILEVNGDFWHANPIKYKADDILTFPKTQHKASELREKDKLKKEVAENENYIIFYLREYEINKMNDEQILQYIKNQIYKKD